MMKRKRMKIVESNKDIISSLPNEVLGHILSYLPSKTAASTCVLSTRWRNLFPLCRILDFDGSSITYWDPMDKCRLKCGRFMDFVERCIVLMNGTHIDKFRLKCGRYIDTSRFNSWICAAVQSNVRELDLCINMYQLAIAASPFFLCTTLVVLKLDTGYTPLDVPADVHLPCLKILHLDSKMFSGDQAPPIQRLVSGCPVLEVFSIVGRNRIKGIIELSLSSSSLKRLTIEEGLIYKLVLDAPSLLYLKLFVSTGSCYAMKNIHSLSEAYVSLSFSFEPTALAQLFEGISNVRSLNLSGSLYHAFLQTTFDEPLVLENLTCLKLGDVGHLELSVVMKLLRWCPNLEEFSFNISICRDYEDGCVDVPSIVPSRLKIVKCWLFYDGRVSIERDIAMLEYFLNNARVLEKMQIRICCHRMTLQRGIEEWETTMGKLARSPGRSKTCNLRFIFTRFGNLREEFVVEK